MTQLLDSPLAPSPDSDFSDEELMELIQNHEHCGLALLYGRYAALIRTICMKVLHNDADSEDLVQEIFMEISDRAASYDSGIGRPLSWIATLARRRAIDRLRKRETYCKVEVRYAEECECHVESWTHVHEEILHSERSAHLQRALATLPEVQRLAIELAFHQQMTQREIAAHTGIPLGTVKTRLELGLRKMAACLKSHGDLLAS